MHARTASLLLLVGRYNKALARTFSYQIADSNETRLASKVGLLEVSQSVSQVLHAL